MTTRRDLLTTLGTAGITALGAGLAHAQQPATAAEVAPPGKVFRIGVIAAAKHTNNGHTWNFAHYLHPTCDFDALKRNHPGAYEGSRKLNRNPKFNFDQLPFPDTRLTHYYEADPKAAAAFAETYPGVRAVEKVEQMVDEVDAIWMGDASGYGEDHLELVAPGLIKGLPTFCDKPMGGTVARTKQIIELAQKHNALLMSASAFCHEWGLEAALRMRDSKEFGPIECVSAHLNGHLDLRTWMIYGQHPVWTVMRLMGAGVDAVSLYEYPRNQDNEPACHALITYSDGRYPCRVWCGQPYGEKFEYNRTDVYFRRKLYSYTPSIEGDFEYGHHYRLFRLAATFRQMLLTRQEPAPHQEILEVTAIIHAAAKSLKEQSRLVKLAEVLG